MRLVCPKCAAQYEVGDDAIPEAGRSVQCSDCGHGWFQRRVPEAPQRSLLTPDPPQPGLAAPSVVPTAGDGPAAPAQPRKPLDEHVMAILREEALREAAARRADAARATGQSPQPISNPSAQPPDARSAQPHVEALPPRQPAPDRPVARRGLLPDIAETNTALAPKHARPGDPPLPSEGQRPGFRTGFALMAGLLVAAAAAYVLAPRVTALLPQSAGAMTAYVDMVDQLRRQLDATVTTAQQGVETLLQRVE